MRAWGAAILLAVVCGLASAGTADLGINVIPPTGTVVAGTDLTYTIIVMNNGPDAAINGGFVDNLPPGTTFVALSVPPGFTAITPAVGAYGTVSATNPSMAFGVPAVFALTVRVAPSMPASALTNTAVVVSNSVDLMFGNNAGTATVNVVSVANLSVTCAHAPDPVAVGATLTYTLTVTNFGPSDATNVLLADMLPAGMTFDSLVAPVGWIPSTPPPGQIGTVTATIPSLPPGIAIFELRVRIGANVPDGTTRTNTATVSWSMGIQTCSSTVTIRTGPRLSGTLTVSGDFKPTKPVLYTVTLFNSGALAQRDNVGDEFSLVLPAELTLVSASATSGTASANSVTNTVAFNGIIGAGGVTISIDAVINAGTAGATITAQGSIFEDSLNIGVNAKTVLTDDPALNGAADPTSFQVLSPPVALALLSGPTVTPAPASVGQLVTFSVGVAGTEPLIYLWTIAGVPTTGAAPQMLFPVAGVYTAQVTVSDDYGDTVSGSVTFTIVEPAAGTGFDSDGDGFSDALEIAAGTDPQNAADSLNGGAPPVIAALSAARLSIRLNFAKENADAIGFGGTLPVGAGFQPAGQTVALIVGDMLLAVKLSDKGKAAGFALGIKSKKGVVAAQTAKYAVKLKAENFAQFLTPFGFANADTHATLDVPVKIVFGGTIYAATKTVDYKARQGKSGVAKGK